MKTNRIVRVRGAISLCEMALRLFPSLRTESMIAEESLTQPMKLTPTPRETRAGNQPQMLAAVIGPTIGPAAAIDLKWYPYRTFFDVGMKSTPSMYIRAGVAFLASDPMTSRSIILA